MNRHPPRPPLFPYTTLSRSRGAQPGNRRDHALLMTLRHTGIRVAELCDLRVGDVVTSERKGTLTVRAGKGMKQRTVPLNADVRRALAGYLTEARAGADAGDFLFLSRRTKGRLTEKAVRELAAKYGYHAMVEDAHPHAFRPTPSPPSSCTRACPSPRWGRCWATSRCSRSEERRVGKERRSRWSPYHYTT